MTIRPHKYVKCPFSIRQKSSDFYSSDVIDKQFGNKSFHKILNPFHLIYRIKFTKQVTVAVSFAKKSLIEKKKSISKCNSARRTYANAHASSFGKISIHIHVFRNCLLSLITIYYTLSGNEISISDFQASSDVYSLRFRTIYTRKFAKEKYLLVSCSALFY